MEETLFGNAAWINETAPFQLKQSNQFGLDPNLDKCRLGVQMKQIRGDILKREYKTHCV